MKSILLVVVARGGCHIGMALLTALPVSTGNARTLEISVHVWEEVGGLTFCLHQLHSSNRTGMLASRRSAFLVSNLKLSCLDVLTYGHAHRDHKTNRGTNNFAMTGILVAGTD